MRCLSSCATCPPIAYAQVAENQKRHGLTPLELARFIREQVDAGESNATIARQLGMNLTTVAHHLVAAGAAAGTRRRAEVGPLHVAANAARTEQAA